MLWRYRVNSPLTNLLNFNTLLIRWFLSTPDELGTTAYWQQPLDQLYAQMPFRGLFEKLKLNIWHMDHGELTWRVEHGQWCLKDYDTSKPGYQVADGLTASEIDLAVFPDGWRPEDTNQARPLPASALSHARKALSHEFGHWHQGQCRYGQSDPIAQKITQWWQANRPHQAGNEYEDWAECYRATHGADECRGFFSDNKPFNPSPELYAFLRCAYWLQGNLAGKQIANFQPANGGVMYQALFADGWHIRWIGVDWRSWQYEMPANAAPYWKPL